MMDVEEALDRASKLEQAVPEEHQSTGTRATIALAAEVRRLTAERNGLNADLARLHWLLELAEDIIMEAGPWLTNEQARTWEEALRGRRGSPGPS